MTAGAESKVTASVRKSRNAGAANACRNLRACPGSFTNLVIIAAPPMLLGPIVLPRARLRKWST